MDLATARALTAGRAVLAASLLLAVACGGGEEPEALERCTSALTPGCAELYQPTFNEIHRRTLAVSCAEPGNACHSSEGRRAGLDLEDIDRAYQGLLDPGLGRVVPGDPECSLLMVRLNHPGRSVMPPGAPLSEAERCAIATWIREGAAR
ncbi:MAG: hypothetical protein KIT72_12270 [Polyangiaceae bacterium]|nr:hypothetical protein [Polyangiaceae bacterium]MCW5791189.1 hypothetical protein [Polyangiaceae bacterium]